MLDLGLEYQHVLVTGASGGIGIEIARVFMEQGAKVTVQYNKSVTALESFAQEQDSTRLHVAQADLSLESSVRSLFTSATSVLGPVHIAVINHGNYIDEDVMLKDMTLERWNTLMDTNLTSAFLVAREFLKGIEKSQKTENLSEVDRERLDRSSIVFVGSTAGLFGEANHSDYAAAKSAVMYGLTLSLKNEIVKIAPRGRVNCVAPGWTHTPKKTEMLKDPDVVYRITATLPLKKIATTYDIAIQIALLSSTKVSGHVSGHVVDVAGGMEGRLLNMREKA